VFAAWFCLSFTAAALAQQDRVPPPKPLPSGDGAVLLKDLRALQERFEVEQLVADYRSRCGDRAPDAAFEALIARAASDDEPDWRYTQSVVDRAAHRGPVDPLMYWFAAAFETAPAARRGLVDKAIAGLRDANAHPLALLVVHLRARRLLGTGGGDPYLEGLEDAIVACAGDERMAGVGQWHLLNDALSLRTDVDSASRPLIDRMLAADVKDRYAALTLDGMCHVSEAWAARSSRAASRVTAKGWQGFQSHLEAAAESLTAAYELHPELPEATGQMISVCGGLGQIRHIRGWLDASVAACFDYAPAYRAALHFYSVRWGGSAKLQLGLGEECAATGR